VAHAAQIRGRAYGFSEWYQRGHRTLFHDGGAPGFLSRVLMAPDQRLGLFVSHTLGTDLDLYRDLTGRVLDLFTEPGQDEPVPGPAAAQPPAGQPYSGYYRSYDLPAGSFGRLLLTLQATKVGTRDDGTLTLGGTRYRMVSADPPLYWADDTDDAEHGANDAVTFSAGRMHRGTATLERLSWWEGPTAQFGALALFVLFFLASAILALVRRPRIAGRLLWGAAAVVNLAFVVGFAYAAQTTIGADPMLLVYGLPPMVTALLWLPFGAAALSVAAGVRGGLGWRAATPVGRGYAVACAVTAVAFVGYLYFWNLLGWNP
jgi:hypothetical protein